MLARFSKLMPAYAINIGGGPNFWAWGWLNLEEVIGPANPVSYYLSPECVFPAKDTSIDIVYNSHNLEHLNDKTIGRLLSEAHRVLTPKGCLVLKLPDFEQVLEKRNEGDNEYFTRWGIEDLAPNWSTFGIRDTIDYRTAMIFCGYWNQEYGNNHFESIGSPSGIGPPGKRAYHGPPLIAAEELASLLDSGRPKQISTELRRYVENSEMDYRFNHQNAWSRLELTQLLNNSGFEVRTFDTDVVIENCRNIPGIESYQDISMYCIAKKISAGDIPVGV